MVHNTVQIEVVTRVLQRLEDLKLDAVILKKYKKDAQELGDDNYYQAVIQGIDDNNKKLKHTRKTLREIKASYRTRTGD